MRMGQGWGCLLGLTISTSAVLAQNAAIQGPFRGGTGHWTTVQDGGFEGVLNGPLPVYSGYVLPGSWYLYTASGSGGSATVTTNEAAQGTKAVRIQPTVFNGPGIALTLGATMKLQAGRPYVLSGFVNRLGTVDAPAQVGLDLWGAPGNIRVPVPAVPGWQFVWGVFTPTVAPVGIRAVVDGRVGTNDVVIVDELAITPLEEFRAPEKVLETFNVRFGITQQVGIQGVAAAGDSPSDVWNLYSRDLPGGAYSSRGAVAPLLDVTGKPGNAGLVIENAPGAWGSGSTNALMSTFLYPLANMGPITITVTNLPSGTYDLYAYGHGGPLDAYGTRFGLDSGPVNYGLRATASDSSWRSPVWTEGAQYVRFTNVFVTSREALRLMASGVGKDVPCVNGIQLVRRNADRFRLFPASGEFTNRLTVSSVVDAGLELRFTVDGTEPGSQSPLLSPAWLLTDTTQMRVRAFAGTQPVSETQYYVWRRQLSFDDGIPVEWRVRYFGADYTLNAEAWGYADADKDGTSNLQEYLDGTNPIDPLDGFRTGVRRVPAIGWNSVPGAWYRVLRKASLSETNWVPTTRIQAVGNRTEYVDTDAADEPRFYRVEAERR